MISAVPEPEPPSASVLRLLVIDDDRAIHDDIRRVLAASRRSGRNLAELEALLFDASVQKAESGGAPLPECEILSEYQGQAAVERLEEELEQGRRVDLAIVDMRMPPGWDGLRTVQELWKRDPSLPVAFCTAYSDYTVEQVAQRLGRETIPWLSKPFHSEQIKELVRLHARRGEGG